MKLTLRAVRKSAAMGGKDAPDASGVSIQGSSVYEFEVLWHSSFPPTELADCQHPHVFDMFVVSGASTPSRPCPLLPKVASIDPTWKGPPPEWLEPDTPREKVLDDGTVEKTEVFRIKAEIFAENDKKPSDVFTVISCSTCTACEFASKPTIAVQKDRTKIAQAFAARLKVEDFTGCDLTEEDRDPKRWGIEWDSVRVG